MVCSLPFVVFYLINRERWMVLLRQLILDLERKDLDNHNVIFQKGKGNVDIFRITETFFYIFSILMQILIWMLSNGLVTIIPKHFNAT